MKKRILILEEGPGFGGALISLKTFLSAVSPIYSFYIITSYDQNYLKVGGVVKDIRVIRRKRLYGNDKKFEKLLKKIIGKKAGPLAYCLDRISFCSYYIGKLKKYIYDNNIELIHLNNWPLLNDAGVYVAKKTRKPIVMHVRGFEYDGRLISWLLKQADHIIAISSYIKDRIIQLNINENKISIIPNAIDIEQFLKRANGSTFRKEIGLSENALVIGLPACLVHWKGHRWFLDACRYIFKKIDAFAIIIGDTPDGSSNVKKDLIAYAQQLGIKNKVIFVGHRNDIESAMDACDVIVHASIIPEPFGRTIIEGMALGKPVIATKMGGPLEIIENGKDGFLVPPEEPEILAKQVLTCLKNPGLRKQIGISAKKKIRERYDVKHHARQIETVYSKVLTSEPHLRSW